MPASHRPTVAIVDDDAQLRGVFATALESDYRVLEAGSGEQALELVEGDVDVVLLDRRLPDASGETVLARMRAAGIDVPVAMISGVDRPPDGPDREFDEYVTKPLGVAELREVVAALLLSTSYEDAVEAYYTAAVQLASLLSADTPDELSSDERLANAEERLEAVETRARRVLNDAIDSGRFRSMITGSASTKRIRSGPDAGDADDRIE